MTLPNFFRGLQRDEGLGPALHNHPDRLRLSGGAPQSPERGVPHLPHRRLRSPPTATGNAVVAQCIAAGRGGASAPNHLECKRVSPVVTASQCICLVRVCPGQRTIRVSPHRSYLTRFRPSWHNLGTAGVYCDSPGPPLRRCLAASPWVRGDVVLAEAGGSALPSGNGTVIKTHS